MMSQRHESTERLGRSHLSDGCAVQILVEDLKRKRPTAKERCYTTQHSIGNKAMLGIAHDHTKFFSGSIIFKISKIEVAGGAWGSF